MKRPGSAKGQLMRILIVHQNCPGQYVHLARHLAQQPGNEVVFITQRRGIQLPGIRVVVYKPARSVRRETHHYLRGSEAGVLNAQAVVRVAVDLKREGFTPDVMLGHNGWGEIWYLKDVFPKAPLIGYFEFFYRLHGADVGFEPHEPTDLETALRVRTKNVGNLLGLDVCDLGQTPTQWQASVYPERYRDRLRIVHDGIDTLVAKPDPNARLTLPKFGIDVCAGDDVLTYVARNLEPYRGFDRFMRSLPAILKARPQARVLIVGGDEVSYGARLPDGETYRQRLLDEMGSELDLSRVHFLGKVPYPVFLKILQVSRAHVYLTYPFVLSWSMLEAMSSGCLVIGSRTAPVEEVLREGESGLLVDFFSPREIAERTIDALARPDEYTDLRRRARQTVVECYDLHQIALPAQLELIAEVMQGRRPNVAVH